MNKVIRRGALALAMFANVGAHALELQTDEQKLGYLIGMDIGNSLKREGTEVDIDALVEAIRTTYAGGTTAMTPEEAQALRQSFIDKRRAAAEAESKLQADANASSGASFRTVTGNDRGTGVCPS